MYKHLLEPGEDLVLLSAGFLSGKRSDFLLLLLNVLLVVEGSSELILCARGAGQCFWDHWG